LDELFYCSRCNVLYRELCRCWESKEFPVDLSSLYDDPDDPDALLDTEIVSYLMHCKQKGFYPYFSQFCEQYGYTYGDTPKERSRYEYHLKRFEALAAEEGYTAYQS